MCLPVMAAGHGLATDREKILHTRERAGGRWFKTRSALARMWGGMASRAFRLPTRPTCKIDPLPAGRSGNGAGAELQYLYSFMSFTNGQRQNRVIQF